MTALKRVFHFIKEPNLTIIRLLILGSCTTQAFANGSDMHTGLKTTETINTNEDHPVISRKDIDLVVHGVYCGWGNHSPDYSLPPIDPLDRACMLHDQCYDNIGRFDCRCDEALASEAYTLSRELEDIRLALLSGLVYDIFKFNTCFQ